MQGLSILEREHPLVIPGIPVSDFTETSPPERTVFVAPIGDVIKDLDTKNELRARTILASHGIIPFTLESVERYKRWYAKKHSGVSTRLKIAMATLSTFAVGLLFINPEFFRFSIPALSSEIIVPFYVVGLGTVMSLAILGLHAWNRTTEVVSWSSAALEIFPEINRGVLPTYVRDTAEKIQQELPGSTFSVHYAHEDPFLFLRYGGKEYPIFVWDEHGFVA